MVRYDLKASGSNPSPEGEKEASPSLCGGEAMVGAGWEGTGKMSGKV